jgi:hypothetical protein
VIDSITFSLIMGMIDSRKSWFFSVAQTTSDKWKTVSICPLAVSLISLRSYNP